MTEREQKLLHDSDDATSFEHPSGFSWMKASAQVALLRPELERIVGQPLSYDDAIQDASYFAEFRLEKPGPPPNNYTGIPNPLEVVIAVSFSCFGNLFTVWSCTRSPLPLVVIGEVIAAVEAHGYSYISGEALDEPYTGVYRGPGVGVAEWSPETWRQRFFDYF